MNTSKLKEYLDAKYGDTWYEYEVETIATEEPEASIDQLEFLKAVEYNPDLVFSNVLFFLHAVDVLNHNKVDFNSVPFPTSLELAWAIEELGRIFKDAKPLLIHSSVIQSVLIYILRHEGFENPTKYFKDFVGDELNGPVDLKKEEGIRLYIEGMENGSNT